MILIKNISATELHCDENWCFIYSDAAMDTDEAEKEVPAKKPKPDAVLVSDQYYEWLTKLDDREAQVQFVNCEYDYRIRWHKVLLPINQNSDKIWERN